MAVSAELKQAADRHFLLGVVVAMQSSLLSAEAGGASWRCREVFWQVREWPGPLSYRVSCGDVPQLLSCRWLSTGVRGNCKHVGVSSILML